jgi:hypothetical protein
MVDAAAFDQWGSTIIGAAAAAVVAFFVAYYTVRRTRAADMELERQRESYRAAADLHRALVDSWERAKSQQEVASHRADAWVAAEQFRREFLVQRGAFTSEPELRKQGWRTYFALRDMASALDDGSRGAASAEATRLANQHVTRLGEDLIDHRLGRKITGTGRSYVGPRRRESPGAPRQVGPLRTRRWWPGPVRQTGAADTHRAPAEDPHVAIRLRSVIQRGSGRRLVRSGRRR